MEYASRAAISPDELAILGELERKVLWLASWTIVSVLDGHPATLAWLGAVNGPRVRPLGVENCGQTGSIPDPDRHYGIDADAIVAAAQAIAPGKPIRHLRALG